MSVLKPFSPSPEKAEGLLRQALLNAEGYAEITENDLEVTYLQTGENIVIGTELEVEPYHFEIVFKSDEIRPSLENEPGKNMGWLSVEPCETGEIFLHLSRIQKIPNYKILAAFFR